MNTKMFYEIYSLGGSHKTFWSKFNDTFCKLDYFISRRFILPVVWKDLAYKKVSVDLVQKSFMRLTTGANVMKLFFFLTYEWPSKLGCLSLAGLSSLV